MERQTSHPGAPAGPSHQAAPSARHSSSSGVLPHTWPHQHWSGAPHPPLPYPLDATPSSTPHLSQRTQPHDPWSPPGTSPAGGSTSHARGSTCHAGAMACTPGAPSNLLTPLLGEAQWEGWERSERGLGGEGGEGFKTGKLELEGEGKLGLERLQAGEGEAERGCLQDGGNSFCQAPDDEQSDAGGNSLGPGGVDGQFGVGNTASQRQGGGLAAEGQRAGFLIAEDVECAGEGGSMIEGDIPLAGVPKVEKVLPEVRLQCKMSLLCMVWNVLEFLLWLVSVMFVGRIGVMELAGAALATSFASATGFAQMEGLSTVVETFCGQAHGAGHGRRLGEVLQRSLLILTAASGGTAALWLFVEKFLLAMGQSAVLAAAAKAYLMCMIPGLLGTAWGQCVGQYMRAQGIFLPLVFCSAATLALHIPINVLLIYGLGLGFRGAALATSVSAFINLGFMLAYLTFECSGILRRTWGGWSRACLQEWWPFLQLGIPACAMVSLEWACFEAIILLAGLLADPNKQVAAMTICLNTVAFCYMLPLGLADSTSVRVSNELGANRPGQARLAIYVSLILAVAQGLLLVTVLVLVRNQWPLLFVSSRETEVVTLVASVMPLLAASQLGDGLNAVLTGVLCGSGQQLLGSIVNFVAYYGAGLPLAVWLAFTRKMGIQGLWLGVIIGETVQIAFLLTVIVRTDWSYQAARARSQVFREDGDLPWSLEGRRTNTSGNQGTPEV